MSLNWHQIPSFDAWIIYVYLMGCANSLKPLPISRLPTLGTMHQFFCLAPKQNKIVLARMDELTRQPNNYQNLCCISMGPGKVFPRGNILSFNNLHTKKPNHATKDLEGIFNKNDATLVHKFQLVTYLSKHRRLCHSNHIWPINWIAKVVLTRC
jgi:hypothetical protein